MATIGRLETLIAVTGVILLALGIRTGVAALSPLAGSIELDVPLQGLALGILGTVPPIAYAVSASFSPWFARKFGLEGAVLAVCLVGVCAHVGRAISPNFVSLFLATSALMLAAGVGNVVLPGLVKFYAPNKIGPVTAAYGTAMAFSSAAPSVIGVWLANDFGWRISLGSWAVVSAIGAFPWIWMWVVGTARATRGELTLEALPVVRVAPNFFRSPTALSIMTIFGVSGCMAYSWFSVLPLVLVEVSGLSFEEAALGLGLFTIMGFPMSLLVPHFAIRSKWSGPLVSISVVLNSAGLIGLLSAPSFYPYLWVLLLSMGPLTFPLSLALISNRTANHLSALMLSGFVNKWGYIAAAAAPILVGLSRAMTGDWTLSLILLAVITMFSIPSIFILQREEMVDDEVFER